MRFLMYTKSNINPTMMTKIPDINRGYPNIMVNILETMFASGSYATFKSVCEAPNVIKPPKTSKNIVSNNNIFISLSVS